jgi:N-acetylmuramoyl-L-alanine amidase
MNQYLKPLYSELVLKSRGWIIMIACLNFSFVIHDTNEPINGWVDSSNINPPKSLYAVRRIVIDAGHGGHDPGCVGSKSKEKDVALAISLRLGAMLEKNMPDVEVIYTRKTDIFLELHQRAAIANKNNADLFISIHCNAAESKSSYGTETFVLGLHRAKDNLDVAKRENASIYFERDFEKNYDGYDPNSAQGHILLSLFQNAYLDQSIFLAEKIERNFKSHKRTSRGVKQGGFLVLRHATMPAVLVEAGFLSNIEEEKWLISEEGQQAIAGSIFNSIKIYKESYDAIMKDPNELQSEPLAQASERPVSDIEFCIQFASASSASTAIDKRVEQLSHVIARSENGIFKHQAIGLSSYEEALLLRDRIRKLGFKDAFVVAYKKGEKMALQQAIDQSAKLAQN